MHTTELRQVCLHSVKSELRRAIFECNKRGLQQSAKWLAEMNLAITTGPTEDSISHEATAAAPVDCPAEEDQYLLAKSFFDCREYDRAAHFLAECQGAVSRFLYFYALYLAHEKRKQENLTEDLVIECNAKKQKQHPLKDSALVDLMTSLSAEHSEDRLDGYGLYLYGVVLKKLDLNHRAVDIFLEAVRKEPMLWSAWSELSLIVTDREQLYSLSLPSHWMTQIFYANTLVELCLNDEGIKLFEDLESTGFACAYTRSQMAIAYLNNRDVEQALVIFEDLQRQDPYRLDNLDLYSNVLFIKDMRVEMAQLAHKVISINKYRPESCCVIGNYFSIRSEHQKAILYFQRALKLNPNYLFAWTLMGHEFMEIKNTNGAIQSYRKAIEVHPRDFRAWYGLGQAYEILKMPIYSLYYYKMSHRLRPSDSRMLVALGETYEKLDRSEYALKCYQKACNVGDIEGYALLKLGYLYEKLGFMEKAVPAFLSFCAMDRVTTDKLTLYKTYMKLGHYYESEGNLREAQHYAQTALEHEDTKQEAKALLKTINKKMDNSSGGVQSTTTAATAVTTAPVASDATANETDVAMEESEVASGVFNSRESLSLDYSEDN